MDSLRGTREAGKDQLDSLRGTREAPGRQERTIWTACEAPGRQERINWTVCEAPGRHQGSRKEPFGQLGKHQGGRKGSIGQPARHQGGTREAGKDQLDSLRGTREAPGRLVAQDCRSNLGFGRAPDFVQLLIQFQWRTVRIAANPGVSAEAGKNHLTCSTGLPIESRFWKGAGFCLTFNTSSMANGPVRGKSWGGRHGRLPSTD